MWETDDATTDHLEYTQAPLSCVITGERDNAQMQLTKSSIWNALKTVNSEINSWKSIFLSSRVQEILLPGGSSDIHGNFIVPNSPVNKITHGGAIVLVTHLVSDSGVHHIIFVNQDYKNKQVLQVLLNEGYNIGFMKRPGSSIVGPVEPEPEEPSPVEPGKASLDNKTDQNTQSEGKGMKTISKTLDEGGIAVLQWSPN